MDGFWNLIAKFFEAIFSVMSVIGPHFNLLLIIIGFVAFILWVGYMSRQKETEKFN